MNRRIIISEEEKNRILNQHNRVLEQDRKSTFGAGLENPWAKGNPLTNSSLYTPKDYVQTPELKLPTQQPSQNNDFRFYDPKTFQKPETSLINTIANQGNIETQPIADTPPKTDTPPKVQTPRVRTQRTSNGGGGQQPVKIDNYQVYGIQDILNKKFNLNVSPDGKWGPKTAQAVLDSLK
jgi:hypothetical protein